MALRLGLLHADEPFVSCTNGGWQRVSWVGVAALSFAALSLTALSLAGCDDDLVEGEPIIDRVDATVPPDSLMPITPPSDAGPPGSVRDAAAAPDPVEPLYLIQTRVFTPEGTTGVLIPTPTLDGPFDYSRVLEQPGGGVLYADSALGFVMLGDGEAPVITRYEADAAGRLVPGARLSFANEGVAFLYAGSISFVSATKAYYYDLDQLQAISFDPTAMAITGRVSLAAAEREGFFTSFGEAVVRPDGVYFPAQWYVDPDWDRVPQGSLLVRIDPATDEVTMTSDSRCTSMLASLTTASGDTYWFSDMFNTFARVARGPGNGFPDCALRLRAGEQQFDPSWQLDTGARMGGVAAVAVLQADDTKMWLRGLEPSVAATLGAKTTYQDLDTAQAWQWYLLDVASDGPAVRDDQRPLASMSAVGFSVDGRAFTSLENADYSESILLELSAGSFVERATVRGVIDTIVRLR